MSAFEAETAITELGGGRYSTELSTAWNIGESANGGYAMSGVLRALRDVADQPDPLTVTTHFLRPVQGGGTGEISTELVRRGRTVCVVSGTLRQADADRLVVHSVFGDVGAAGPAGGPSIEAPPPSIPAPADCVDRTELAQGVDLPITSRIDVCVAPDRASAEGTDEAVMEGWIRLADGTAPSTLTLPLFTDAFPPSLFARYGRVGWVPTIELTVQVRRRPVSGWVQARFECDDLLGGRMIESGTLWDAAGRVVARSRQLGLLLQG